MSEEAVFAFRGEALVKLIKRDEAANSIAMFLQENLAKLPEEVQDQAKSLLADWDGKTTTEWGPRRLA